jgi:ferredoxin-NADP reductase
MEEHIVKILGTEYITHDVKRITVQRPAKYHFKSGQATEVSINKPEWKNERRPFTFTSLDSWKDLEFTIKIYEDHKGVTNEIGRLRDGDELLLHDVWGAISYQGKGVFIAGGAGITPFISIFRQLEKDNDLSGHKLIFSNKTSDDIILRKEFERMLGPDFVNVLTREKVIGFQDRRIDKEFLKTTIRDFSQQFYVCGPEVFTNSIQEMLVSLGAQPETVVIEK